MTTHTFTTSLSVPACQIRLQRYLDTMSMPQRFGLAWQACEDDTWCCFDDWSGAHFDLYLRPHNGHTDVVLEGHRVRNRGFIAGLLALSLVGTLFFSLGSVWFIPVLMGLAGGLTALYAQQNYLQDLEVHVVQRIQTALPIDG